MTTVDESLVRWCPADELFQRQQAGALVIDAREPPEYEENTLPGARLLGQTALMFSRDAQQELVDELRAAVDEHRELIFFGNTANPAGGHSGRDLWVLNFLWEVEGFPLAQLARLEGGFKRWVDAGGPAHPGREQIQIRGDPSQTLATLCEENGLSHLAAGRLGDETCAACKAVLDSGGRPALLAWLQERGCAKLGERQKLASAIAKAIRACDG